MKFFHLLETTIKGLSVQKIVFYVLTTTSFMKYIFSEGFLEYSRD